MHLDSNFIVIPGAQKAGTTTFHRLLTQHSQINSLVRENGKSLKESVFFAMKPQCVADNFDWFRSLLRNGESTYVDASPQYLMSPQAPRLIHKYLGADTKVIVTIRDPVDRCISSFLHQKSRNPPTDKRSLDKIVQRIWRSQKLGLVEAENAEVYEAKKSNKISGIYLEKKNTFQIDLSKFHYKTHFTLISIFSIASILST